MKWKMVTMITAGILLAGAVHAAAAFGFVSGMSAMDDSSPSAAVQCLEHCLNANRAVSTGINPSFPIAPLFAAVFLSVLLWDPRAARAAFRRFSQGAFDRLLLHRQLATVLLKE